LGSEASPALRELELAFELACDLDLGSMGSMGSSPVSAASAFAISNAVVKGSYSFVACSAFERSGAPLVGCTEAVRWC
jgi:hypothetical protein